MASEAVYAANVTKYNAGGSGDNYIPDGYIKTVEKIWMDSYTIAFTGTNATIDIAVLPANKKIIGIDIVVNSSISQTSGTISVGFSTDASVNTLLPATDVTHNATTSVIRLPTPGFIQIPTATSTTLAYGVLAGFQKVTGGTQTTISVKLNNWTMTTGTVKSIVRYT